MSVHVEWFEAEDTGAEVVGAGEQVGEGTVSVGRFGLVLGWDSYAVFEGSLDELADMLTHALGEVNRFRHPSFGGE